MKKLLIMVKKDIKQTLEKMKPEQEELFPIERMNSVRATCTNLKRTKKMHFFTTQMNDAELIIVTRIS